MLYVVFVHSRQNKFNMKKKKVVQEDGLPIQPAKYFSYISVLQSKFVIWHNILTKLLVVTGREDTNTIFVLQLDSENMGLKARLHV